MVQSIEQAGLMLLAPAKLNLTLEVLGKRSDGFHEIRSILQTIDLWDSIYMELRPYGIDFHCSRPNLENPENLGWRAAENLKALPVSKGISIRLQKGIPEAAGLGGGSSDAAATLKGLDYLWETNLGHKILTSMASQLSSDAPFFMVGGTAQAEGRGEIITSLPALPPNWLVILKPDIVVPLPKTARLYSSLSPEHFTNGEYTSRLKDKLLGSSHYWKSTDKGGQVTCHAEQSEASGARGGEHPTPDPSSRQVGTLRVKHRSPLRVPSPQSGQGGQGDNAKTLDKLSTGIYSVDVNELIFNAFDMVAFQVYPGLSRYRDWFKSAGALSVHLAGSGPALFTLTGNREKAIEIYNNLQKERLEVYLARTRN